MQARGGSRSRWGPGQPPGLTALFFAQLWERLATYGGLVLLVLYLGDIQGGLGVALGLIPVLYGLFAAAVLLSLLAGGWLADHWLGRRWSLFLGGGLITTGLLTAGLAGSAGLAAGLTLEVVGIGLFRPALLVTLSELYGREPSAGLPARRVVGFTVIYLGINLGALAGYPTAALVGSWFGWPLGFAAAGLAMALGLLIMATARRHLPPWRPGGGRIAGALLVACSALAGLAAWLASGQLLSIRQLEDTTLVVLLVAVALMLLWGLRLLTLREPPTLVARQTAALVLTAMVIYGLGLELTKVATLKLEKLHIDRLLLGWEFPTRWIATLDVVFLVLLSLAAYLAWRRYGRRAPRLIARLAIGLALVAVGWLSTPVGFRLAEHQAPGLGWLLVMAFAAACGDVLLVPAGLDAVSGLASRRHAGRLMAAALAAGAFGKLARLALDGLSEGVTDFSGVAVAVLAIVVALLLLFSRKRLTRAFQI